MKRFEKKVNFKKNETPLEEILVGDNVLVLPEDNDFETLHFQLDTSFIIITKRDLTIEQLLLGWYY
jgi:hypothetical protein